MSNIISGSVKDGRRRKERKTNEDIHLVEQVVLGDEVVYHSHSCGFHEVAWLRRQSAGRKKERKEALVGNGRRGFGGEDACT
jgi:hypothetical protein